MKRFALSTRVQRAVKIETILNDMMVMTDRREKVCRCIGCRETTKLLIKLAHGMEKCINKNMYDNKDIYQALVNKVRFKFVSKKCLSDIITTLVTVVHKLGAHIEVDAEMAQVKQFQYLFVYCVLIACTVHDDNY